MHLCDSVEIKMRTYFSIQHIQSAALFCRLSNEIENKYDGIFDQKSTTEHGSYVTNAIFSSICFLEATINEIFCDAVDNQSSIENLGKEKIKLLADMWSLDVPRTAAYSILEKYQIALSLLEKPLFDNCVSPYQNIQILIQLRNALMHYEPKWNLTYSSLESEEYELDNLSKRLRGKFALSKIYKDTGNSFFPDKCLGHGCAKWAVESCVAFADDFFSKIGLKPTFDHVRQYLKTE